MRGARLDLVDAPSLLCFPADRAAYGRLSRLLTLGKRRAEKGQCRLTRTDLIDPAGPFAAGRDQLVVVVPPDDPDDGFANDLRDFSRVFGDRCHLAAHHLYRGGAADVPLMATNDVHFHAPERWPLANVVTCIREGTTLTAAGRLLSANAERHLKPAAEMARLFRRYPDAIARTAEVAARCRFDLEELRYEYPAGPIPDGLTADGYLARLAWEGAAERYSEGVSGKVCAQLEHKLELIAELGYAPYFLTVCDIVRFARSQDILCQGRGSAANSAVCYALGITAVDPAKLDLLFERFVSAERNEPPDIDVDFEHERREEVIQYVYAKYGRERAGLAATVITYRARSAVREVGKALGLSEDTVGAIAGQIWGWSSKGVTAEQMREIGLDPDDATLGHAIALSQQLIGFPRHLSQHVGGFIITKGRLDELVLIENAAMEDRTVIEWDKDDLGALGILKIDVLALGMLTCIRKAFDMLERHYGRRLALATVPAEGPAVYDMLCRADSLGVFQVESRSQMAFLPRMKPRSFYDLVIEVAIVRPGPIQGDMVHPYLRRRNGEEQVDYPSKELREVLGKTLGVPLFQEQAMKIAIVGAGFTPSEADGLRRAMATFRHVGTIHTFQQKMIGGMTARGYEPDFAERCFRQIEGFGEYGFPESHAASFALLVYVSSWIKCHYPEVFAAALINSQPMGFYAPAQIVRDAREHGVDVRAPDVDASDWDCTLEPPAEEASAHCALRLGFRQIKGFKEDDAVRIAAARPRGGIGGAGAILVDVSEWQEAEHRLRQAQKMEALGKLTGGVAHDFNNLLAVIIGNLDLMLDGAESGDDNGNLARIAHAAALRGADLTQRLLTYARSQDLRPRPIDVPDMRGMLSRTLGESVEVTIDVADDIGPCHADRNQLDNAILNLAVNAREAFDGAGSLIIRAQNATSRPGTGTGKGIADLPPGEYVRFAVIDDGPGMSADVRRRAFEPFFTTSADGRGTGLGLSTVYGFARQSGGVAQIISAEGRGTTVEIFLPRADSAPSGAAARPAPDAANAMAHVLLVEDDPDVRQTLAGMLSRMGCRTTCAEDGPAALELVANEAAFDILVTDIGLPGGLDGRALAESVAERCPNLPTLFVSGYSFDGATGSNNLPDGAAMLQKPFSRINLQRSLEGLLKAQAA